MSVATLAAPTRASFSDLKLKQALHAAIDRMGFTTPTPIQSQAIPPLLEGRDLVGQARTGSGKTLAFALPLVQRCDPDQKATQALVLVPTRELANQVAGVITPLAQAARLRVSLLYGGRSLAPEMQTLRGRPHIVVGTPGRTLDHLRQGNLNLQRLKIFVLDEADEMLDKGFAPDVERILGFATGKPQGALFSATMPAWVSETAKRHLSNPVTVRVDRDLEPPPEIEHTVYHVERGAKVSALRALLDNRGPGSVLVFGRTKHGVKKLAQQLERLGYPSEAIHGNLSQNARDKVMAGFRSGEVPILLATNVAARGIDVTDIQQVINFELPETAGLFTHRAGRTGRMGRGGETITLVTDEDAGQLRQIEREMNKRLPRKDWPYGKLDVTALPPTPRVPAASSGFGAARRGAPEGMSGGRAPGAPRRMGEGTYTPRRVGGAGARTLRRAFTSRRP